MSSFVAWAASAASTDRGTGLVLFVPAHGERSLVGASRVVSNNVVSTMVTQQWTSHGWWGYCCTGDHSTHSTGSVPLLAPWLHHRLRPIRRPSSGTYLTRSIMIVRSVVCISIAGTPHWRMVRVSIVGICPIVGSVTPARMGITALDACVSRTNSLTTTIVARLSPPQEVMGHSRAKKRVSGRFKKVW